MIDVIDLNFMGFEKAIATFLIDTSEGPVLLETGPHSTFPALEEALAERGVKTADIKHVILSHIHFDHAGASWAFAEKGATIYVHPFGAPHLEKPAKLVESARMIYKDQMDSLWGAINPIDANSIHAVQHQEKIKIGDKTFIGHHTPGHAKHHIAWQLEDVIFTGDVGGCKIEDGPVVPPCPPPDISMEDWKDSIDLILELDPQQMYLTHFGVVENISEHMSELKEVLDDWAQWMKGKWESGLNAQEITPLFIEYTADQMRQKGVDEDGIKRYETANPSWMSVAGLIRYWKKKGDS